MEIWLPYGEVESLLTLQAENLGELIDPAPEGHAEELSLILKERAKGYTKLFACDEKPATVKLLKAYSQYIPQDGTVRVYANSPKTVEVKVPELKGRVLKPSPPTHGTGDVKLSPELAEGGSFVVATGEPDPLFGYLDARAAVALACGTGTKRAAYDSREGDAIRNLEETKAHSALVSFLDAVQGNSYATVVPRGGEPFSLIDGGAKDARAHFAVQELNPAKGIVIGGGGRGFDDTFSHMLRLAMGELKGVRKGGDVLLVGECREGIGSDALRMQAEGRLGEGNLKKAFYADGMEELGYLSTLREGYTVTLLSSMPDLYTNGRFKFKSAKSSGEALQKVFSSTGRGAKLHVVTRAPETVLS